MVLMLASALTCKSLPEKRGCQHWYVAETDTGSPGVKWFLDAAAVKTAVSRVNRWRLDRSGERGSIPSGGAGTPVAADAAGLRPGAGDRLAARHPSLDRRRSTGPVIQKQCR